MAANGISTLTYKAQRQAAKLALAATDRAATGRYSTLDTSLLPTLYRANVNFSGNLVDNANTGGLVIGRPWTSTIAFTLTEHIDLDGFTITDTNVGPLTIEVRSTSYQVAQEDGWIKVNGTTIKTTNLAAASRGHTLAVISPAGAVVGSIITYDTYGSPADQIAIVTALNAVASGNYIAIASWDACAVNASMRTALTNNYGAPTPSPFSTWTPTRYSHTFIGKRI